MFAIAVLMSEMGTCHRMSAHIETNSTRFSCPSAIWSNRWKMFFRSMGSRSSRRYERSRSHSDSEMKSEQSSSSW